MGILGDMVVTFSADTSGLQSGVAGAKNAIASLTSNPLAALGTGLAVAGVAAVGLGIASVKMAGDFQSGMTTLVTGAGESQKNIKMVSDGILALATSTGTSTKDLTAGMYQIESAGYHGKAGLDVLTAAAEGAKVGNASLAAVANGVTTAMTDYASSGLTAAQATNTLIATVAAGKTNMNDLASSMASILPTASSVGVKFVDVSGAMATMTGEGVPAADAATYLRQMLMALENPAAKGAAALKDIGLSTTQVSDEMKVSLPGTIQMISDALAKKFPVGSQAYIKAMSDIAGGTKQMQGMLDLTGQHLSVFQGNVATISGTVKQAGSSISGWSLVQEDFNQKMDQARAAVEVLGIKVGTALLPVITPLVAQIAPIISQFASWLVSSGALTNGITGLVTTIRTIVTVIATVVGVGAGILTFFKQNELAALALLIPLGMLSAVLVQMAVTAFVAFLASIPAIIAGFIAWATAAGAAAIATLAATWPILAIGAAVGVVVAIIILAVQHWGAIASFLQGAWQATLSWLQGALQAIGAFFTHVWQGIQSGVSAFIGFITNVIKIGFQVIYYLIFGPILLIIALFKLLYDHNTYFKDLVDAITGFFKTLFAWATTQWNSFVSWLSGVWDSLLNIGKIVWAAISSSITTVVSALVSWLTGVWTSITGWLQGEWNQLAGFMNTAWQAVSGVVSGAWNTYIAQPLQGIWNNISSWFTNLATQFYNSGKNFISMLVSGITSGAGAIWNAVSSIASNIWSALGFHSPAEKGPASDADTWMPNLINMFVSGLNAGVPKIATASQNVAAPLHQNLSYPVRPSAGVVPVVVNAGSSANSGTSGQTLIFEVDGRQLAQITNTNTNKMVRVKLGAKGYAGA